MMTSSIPAPNLNRLYASTTISDSSKADTPENNVLRTLTIDSYQLDICSCTLNGEAHAAIKLIVWM